MVILFLSIVIRSLTTSFNSYILLLQNARQVRMVMAKKKTSLSNYLGHSSVHIASLFKDTQAIRVMY